MSAGSGFTGASAPSRGSGFTYLRNRWYDPATGRFLTQDPIGLAGGVNLYAYAGNNPIAFSDPFGLCKDSEKGNATQSEKCASDITGQWCPSGSKGSYPDCKSAATGAQVPGSCPNVSGQEWDVGQDAIERTEQSGVEEGSIITRDGQVVPMTGPDWVHTDRSIGPRDQWPGNAATAVHGHPSGNGISPGDQRMTNSTGIRGVSAGVRTSRYGSYSRGGTPTTCDLPTRP